MFVSPVTTRHSVDYNILLWYIIIYYIYTVIYVNVCVLSEFWPAYLWTWASVGSHGRSGEGLVSRGAPGVLTEEHPHERAHGCRQQHQQTNHHWLMDHVSLRPHTVRSTWREGTRKKVYFIKVYIYIIIYFFGVCIYTQNLHTNPTLLLPVKVLYLSSAQYNTILFWTITFLTHGKQATAK